jgi:hypothetical protein
MLSVLSGIVVFSQESYQSVARNGNWHQKLEYPGGDAIVIHSPSVIMHYTAPSPGYSWASAVVCNMET